LDSISRAGILVWIRGENSARYKGSKFKLCKNSWEQARWDKKKIQALKAQTDTRTLSLSSLKTSSLHTHTLQHKLTFKQYFNNERIKHDTRNCSCKGFFYFRITFIISIIASNLNIHTSAVICHDWWNNSFFYSIQFQQRNPEMLKNRSWISQTEIPLHRCELQMWN